MSDFKNLFTEKYRPQSLSDIVLSKDDRIFFESLASKKEIPHLLFAGIQGSGKTSLAKIIINDILKCEYLYINASDETGIDTIRSKVIGFARTKSFDGNIKVVLLDEADSISFEAMKALRNVMEEFSATCRFVLTCNYLHKIILPIQSRCAIINLTPPIEGVVQRIKYILQQENINLTEEQKPLLVSYIRKHLPDVRRIVNDIQKFSVTGTLNIKNDTSVEFAHQIFKILISKQDVIKLRKEIIENEKNFSSDYKNLLRQLFEVVYESSLSQEAKAESLLLIAKGMEADSFVIDKEINAFSVLINLSKLLTSTTSTST
jgi:DNA polymerase III delta prime subunit